MQTQTQTPASQTQNLHHVLHATFDLYRATHMAHWNIRGPYFPQLHALFEAQYTELWTALDEIAERIRALGDDVDPHALDGNTVEAGHDAAATLNALAETNRRMAKHLRSLEGEASDAGDAGTADLFTVRIQAHEKAAWMLDATRQGV